MCVCEGRGGLGSRYISPCLRFHYVSGGRRPFRHIPAHTGKRLVRLVALPLHTRPAQLAVRGLTSFFDCLSKSKMRVCSRSYASTRAPGGSVPGTRNYAIPSPLLSAMVANHPRKACDYSLKLTQSSMYSTLYPQRRRQSGNISTRVRPRATAPFSLPSPERESHSCPLFDAVADFSGSWRGAQWMPGPRGGAPLARIRQLSTPNARSSFATTSPTGTENYRYVSYHHLFVSYGI